MVRQAFLGWSDTTLTQELITFMKRRLEGFSRFLKRWAPAFVWMAVMVIASTDLGSTSASYGMLRPLLKWLYAEITEPDIYRINLLLRKLLHVIEFAILAILVWRAWERRPGSRRRGQGIALALGIAALFAAATETIQFFMKSRGASVYDVLLNISAACLGLVLLSIWRAFRGAR